MSNLSQRFIQYLISRLSCVSSSEDEIDFRRRKSRSSKYYTLFEQLPTELFLEIFEYLSLVDIYTIFYNLNIRFNQLIIFSCIRGFIIHSTKENNFYFKYILPYIPSWKINTLKLWHNSSYEQLLYDFPDNLNNLHTLVLKQLKNLSFYQCNQLLKHLKSLEILSIIDFHTNKVDWLDDNNWKNLIDINLPHLRHLDVQIFVIYDKLVYDDDKDNIIYSFTSRYSRPTYRLYTGSLLRRDPILAICLTIHRVFPTR